MSRGVPIAAWVLLFALPASAQRQPQEARRVVNPEEQVGCPVPTLEQCQAEGYLEEDSCGILQAQNDWTCARLFREAVDNDGVPESVSIIAFELDELGVNNRVKKYGEEPIGTQERYYTPDMGTFRSQSASRSFLPAQQIAYNPYPGWEANGAEILSCEEYVYEKFLDQTEFERLVGTAQHDYRRVFDIAYGPDYEASSIGRRHLTSPYLRGRDLRAYGWMFDGSARPKNGFFELPMFASLPGQNPVSGAPSLALSLAGYNLLGLIAVNLIVERYDTVEESWSWHLKMSETLSVEGKKQLGFQLPPPNPEPSDPWTNFQITPPPEDPDEANDLISEWTGLVPDEVAGNKPLRRYLDDELDEYYDLQRRLRRLIREWARADQRFEGSGWTVADLKPVPEKPGLSPNQVLITNPPQTPLPFAAPAPAIPPGSTPFQLQAIELPPPENLIRKRILEEILALYLRAAEIGCLEEGLTPCDWSPKLFARAVLHRFTAEREAAYDLCNEYVPMGEVNRLHNLSIDFIDEPPTLPNGELNPLAIYDCGVYTGSKITADRLEQVIDQVDLCRGLIPPYLEAKAIFEAEQRLQAIPELIDPATGNIRKPGIADGGGEDKGNKYFGLFYDWGYGFRGDYGQSECKFDVFAGGHFELVGKVLTKTIPLVDAVAEVSTEDRSVDVHAKVHDNHLFTPINRTYSVNDTVILNDIVKSVGTGDRDFASAGTTVFAGPVPLKLTAGIAGKAGVELSMDARVNDLAQSGDEPAACPSVTVGAGVEPYMQIDGFAQAGINLVVAEAGVRGTLTIIRVSVPFVADLTLERAGANDDGLTFPQNVRLVVGTGLSLELNTLSGSIGLYGKIGICPLCKKGEVKLVKWDGLTIERNIFRQDYEVYVGDLILAAGN